jgi:hypothetical protein
MPSPLRRERFEKGFHVKNAVRLGAMGLLSLGLFACGGEEVAGQEQEQQPKPVMSQLRMHRDGAGKAAEEGKVRQLGPAPNLTDIEVIAVCSDAFYTAYYPYQCEDVTGVNGTAFNHGGTIIIITEEWGYRQLNTQSATMGGYSVPEVYNDPILNIYNEMIGWHRYWQPANGQQSGTFSYSARSINTNTLYSDWMSVQ